jgi:hypothetical protein
MNAQAANEINEMVQTLKVVKAVAKPKQTTKAKAKSKATYKPRTKRSPVPRTARAYMKTLGHTFDKESVAVTELIKLHSESKKPESQKPAPATTYLFTPAPAKEEPKSLWQRWFGK